MAHGPFNKMTRAWTMAVAGFAIVSIQPDPGCIVLVFAPVYA
jgi:hypothetical protein